jgi:copper transport protein
VPAAGPARLRRTVTAELGGAAVVLALSASLVQLTPGPGSGPETVTDNVGGVTQTLTSPLFTLQFNIYPVQLGDDNTVHAFVYTHDGKPLDAKEWRVTTVLPARGLEPVSIPMLGVLPHHALGSVAFPAPGTWEVRFTVRTSEIDQATVRTTVTVR